MAAEDREPTFEELFEANPATPAKEFRIGDTVSGVVVNVGKDSIFVDLGGKSEGIADAAEFLDSDGNLPVKPGDRLELKVTSVSDGIYLSKGLKVRGERALDVLRQAFESELPVEGKVSGVNKGGLDVEIAGLRAFCPVSQIDLGFCEKPEDHVGEKYTFRIQEFREKGRNIIVSRRVLLEEEREKMAQKVLETLQVGDELKAVVTRLMNYGAFVDIGGIEGMVHVSEMAHHRVNHPSDVVQVGEEVRVRIQEFKPGTKGKPRISCSMKALEPTPWEAGLPFREGDVVTGKVVRLMDFGAFVEISPGLEGLVHVSEVSYERIPHPGRVLEEGQQVAVRVLSVDLDRKRISLSVKEALHVEPASLDGPEGPSPQSVKLEKGALLDGVVEKIGPRAVHVRLPQAGPGVRGFLPASEAGLQPGEDLKKTLSPGTRVQVMVEAVESADRARVSRRAVQENRERAEAQQYMNQAGKPKAMATFGDLFKDLKLPDK